MTEENQARTKLFAREIVAMLGMFEDVAVQKYMLGRYAAGFGSGLIRHGYSVQFAIDATHALLEAIDESLPPPTAGHA